MILSIIRGGIIEMYVEMGYRVLAELGDMKETSSLKKGFSDAGYVFILNYDAPDKKLTITFGVNAIGGSVSEKATIVLDDSAEGAAERENLYPYLGRIDYWLHQYFGDSMPEYIFKHGVIINHLQ